MPDMIAVTVDGARCEVANGTTALVATLMKGARHIRRSVGGQARGPLCAMGICFECRATINGERHRRSCMVLCEQGMDIRTDE